MESTSEDGRPLQILHRVGRKIREIYLKPPQTSPHTLPLYGGRNKDKKYKNKIMKKYEELTREEKLACVSLYPEESKKDTNENIRREAWRVLGYTEEAKKDSSWIIRLEAWRSLGYTEEAKRDTYWIIRDEAWRALGYTEEARRDTDLWIRLEAEIYINIKNS